MESSCAKACGGLTEPQLTAFCWNVYDGTQPDSELSDFQKDRAIKQLPPLLDYFGFVVRLELTCSCISLTRSVLLSLSFCWTSIRLHRLRALHHNNNVQSTSRCGSLKRSTYEEEAEDPSKRPACRVESSSRAGMDPRIPQTFGQLLS